MKSITLILAFICAASCQVQIQPYNKFVWEDCGSPQVIFNSVDVSPMPIVQPGVANLKLDIILKRAITGVLKVKLDIVRAVRGVALPVRCYKVQPKGLPEFFVGSCDYPDLCTVIKKLLPKFSKDNCPKGLAPFGIDCTCPLNVKAGKLAIDEPLDLPDASVTVASWLSSGNFDILLDTSDSIGKFACVKIKFSVTGK